jgi:hypothetical protein
VLFDNNSRIQLATFQQALQQPAGGLLHVVLKYPSCRRHPFAHAPVSLRRILVFGSIESAGVARGGLHPAGMPQSQFFVCFQLRRNVSRFCIFKQDGQCKTVFDRLPGALAKMRNGAKFIWITGKTSTFRARPQRELIQCWRAMCQPVCAPRFLILRRMRF